MSEFEDLLRKRRDVQKSLSAYLLATRGVVDGNAAAMLRSMQEMSRLIAKETRREDQRYSIYIGRDTHSLCESVLPPSVGRA